MFHSPKNLTKAFPLRVPGGRASPQALIKSAYLLYGQSELRPVHVLGVHLWTRQTSSCASGPPPRMCVPLPMYLRGEPEPTSPEVAVKLVKNADSKTHSRLPKRVSRDGALESVFFQVPLRSLYKLKYTHRYTYGWFILMFGKNQQNPVKQLSFN